MATTSRSEAGEDILDSRDLIERAEELRSEDSLDEEEQAELAAIEELADWGITDWQYGAALIHERLGWRAEAPVAGDRVEV